MKKKIAVLFPGIGYTCDKPLLYYTGKLAVARGYKLVKVEYGNFPSGIKENKEKMEEAFRCGLEQAEKILQDICWEEYEDILFVSKSIGTVISSAFARRHQLSAKNILFTPLQQTFLSHYSDTDETLLPALTGFSHELCCFFPEHASYLLPSPEKGSACKRANLMLRWLVRTDAVDPGCWDRVPKRKLLVPLDTHMFRIAKELELCSRSSANLNAVLEITRAFAAFAPEDPVKYDFALTRFGIHPVVNKKKLPVKLEKKGA